MEMAEFDLLAEPVLRRWAEHEQEPDITIAERRTATVEEIATVEAGLNVRLPEKYKDFMLRYGGGQFGYVDLFPIVAEPEEGDQDLWTVCDEEFPDRSFIVVAPVGTGDHWGFPVTDGRCHDEVWFHFHDAGDDEPIAADFLSFVATHGLRP